MALTREQILNLDDIQVKEIDVPIWGKKVYIKQLTRGQQDTYLKRQFGTAQMKQDRQAKAQEFKNWELYGHDAWLCAKGICDEKGNRIFDDADIKDLKTKNGEAIGYIAKEIILYSKMEDDLTAEDEVEEIEKN
jgi:hypothetical protein